MKKKLEVIENIKAKTNEKDTVILYFDPCHLQHNVINTRMWQPRGREVTLKIEKNQIKILINS